MAKLQLKQNWWKEQKKIEVIFHLDLTLLFELISTISNATDTFFFVPEEIAQEKNEEMNGALVLHNGLKYILMNHSFFYVFSCTCSFTYKILYSPEF